MSAGAMQDVGVEDAAAMTALTPAMGELLPTAGRGDDAGAAELERHAAWPLVARLPMRLAAAVPVTGFTVRDLLQLAAGRLLETAWPENNDIPLKAGRVQMSWCEFEVVEQRMSVRLTRLA